MRQMNTYNFGQSMKESLDQCAKGEDIVLIRSGQVFMITYKGTIGDIVHVNGISGSKKSGLATADGEAAKIFGDVR
jgi:hypothetical protein